MSQLAVYEDNLPLSAEVKFDYSIVDKETAEYLQEKAIKIKAYDKLVNAAQTELGKELKEAQELLSQHRYGCFKQWVEESFEFSHATAYKLINRYDLIVNNIYNKELIESQPLSLTYEMSKPSALQEANDKVFSGEIKTHKEYKELEAQIKQRDLEIMRLKSAPAETKVIEKVIEKEVVPQSVLAEKNNLQMSLSQKEREPNLVIRIPE
jgi:hypothetical protein